VVASTNPEWYQKLCAQFVSSRKKGYRSSRTAIKRRETLIALRRIAAGTEPKAHSGMVAQPVYVKLLLPVVEYELKHIGDRHEEQPVAPMETPTAERDDWEPF
jgi:hypothetical protein